MQAVSERPQVAPAPLADPDAFGEAVAPGAPRHRAVRQLYEQLRALNPGGTLSERVAAIEALGKWVRSSGKVPAAQGALAEGPPQILRLGLLVRALEAFPGCRREFGRLVRNTLQQTSAIYFLARLGIPSDRGFFNETVDRLSRTFLPEPEDEADFAQLVARLFPKQRDLDWLRATPEPLTTRLAELLRDPDELGLSTWLPLQEAACDALSLLATRVSAVGLSESLRARSPDRAVRTSPFYELSRSTDAFIRAVEGGQRADTERLGTECKTLVERCQVACSGVVENLEQSGVSVDVVYRLELIGSSLERYSLLLDELVCEDRSARYRGATRQLVRLIEARHRDRKLVEITRTNLHLLARKIIERAGHTGEHYITSSRAEYAKMLLSAGGGGVLTAGTAALKFMIGWGHFAPFVEGMLAAMNYAGSFILMQLLGFTLATKQPSMTAATLAGTLRDSAGQQELAPLVKTIARITRSQLAAAMGNIGLVIPAAVGLETLYRRSTGQSFLDPDTAEYVLHSLDPVHSGTIFYAALTGVLLWLSSVGAGWLENWAVYRRLPEAIAEHRYGRFLGRRVTHWASAVFSRNIAGLGGNTTLGFLLAMTPVAGKFFGLPIAVAHVTLSTGALTFAICSLGRENAHGSQFLLSALGILIIGALNFGVSFMLALAVALRARGADRSDRSRLWRSVLATFVRAPLQFLFPPKSDSAVPVHGPVSVRPHPKT